MNYIVQCYKTNYCIVGNASAAWSDRYDKHLAEVYYSEKQAERNRKSIQKSFDANADTAGKYDFRVKEIKFRFMEDE